jgi:protein-S-isoprenylcysteine O-methyltransferase Ste14
LNQGHLNRPERQPWQNGLALKFPPLGLVVIAAALMWIASSASPIFDVVLPAKSFLAAGLALIGALTCVSGIVSFRHSKTTVNPMKPEEASSLVTSGIYKYTRNPMYLGFVLLLLGWAALLSNLAALALLPAFIVYITSFQIMPEEHALASLFPHAYPAYRARVRRWI